MISKKVFFIILSLFLFISLSLFWLYEGKMFIGRADTTVSSLSVENSYVFVTPLKAKVGGEEKIRVNVFALNSQGLGVIGKTVSINNSNGLSIEAIQQITDLYGKAVFDVASVSAGDYYLDITIDNKSLPQKTKITFE